MQKLYTALYKIISALGFEGIVYRVAQKLVYTHNNENNSVLETNGEYDFLKRNISRFNTVFDVGASVGEWTKLYLDLKRGVAQERERETGKGFIVLNPPLLFFKN